MFVLGHSNGAVSGHVYGKTLNFVHKNVGLWLVTIKFFCRMASLSDRELKMITYLALLLTATLFGGMLLYSFGFAPIVFHAFPSDEAGRFIRLAFPWYYLFVISTSALSCLALMPLNSQSAILMAIVFIVGMFARQILMPKINAARDLQLTGDTAARRDFGILHALSVFLNFGQLAIVGYVLVYFL